MKYFFPVLMGLTILAGLSLIVTPFVAEWLLPANNSTRVQTADPEAARRALADWFGAPVAGIGEARALRSRTAQEQVEWFAFSAARGPVENFVRRHRLQQLELTPEVLRRAFNNEQPPTDWWRPAELQRETWFNGQADGRALALVYDAQRQRGFLVIRADGNASKASGGS